MATTSKQNVSALFEIARSACITNPEASFIEKRDRRVVFDFQKEGRFNKLMISEFENLGAEHLESAPFDSDRMVLRTTGEKGKEEWAAVIHVRKSGGVLMTFFPENFA